MIHKKISQSLQALTLIGLSIVFVGCNLIGGAFEHEPQDLQEKIGPGARVLIEQAYEGIDPSRLRDYHTHLFLLEFFFIAE